MPKEMPSDAEIKEGYWVKQPTFGSVCHENGDLLMKLEAKRHISKDTNAVTAGFCWYDNGLVSHQWRAGKWVRG